MGKEDGRGGNAKSHGRSKRPHGKDRKGAKRKRSSSHKATSKNYIQTDGSSTTAKKQKSSFLCRVKYPTGLPPLPFLPKLLPMPQPTGTDHLIRYCASSLQQTQKHDINAPRMMGIDVDLVDPRKHNLPADVERTVAPEDRPLLEPWAGKTTPYDDQALGGVGTLSPAARRTGPGRRSKRRPNVTWLRKTALLANDLYSRGRQSKLSQGVEPDASGLHTLGGSADTSSSASATVDLAQSEVEQIERTFEAARNPPQHPTNPSLKAVRVLDVFPLDASTAAGRRDFSYVAFDVAPAKDALKRMQQEYARTLSGSAPDDAAAQNAMLQCVGSMYEDKFMTTYIPSSDKHQPPQVTEADLRTAVLGSSAKASSSVLSPSQQDTYTWSREYVEKPATKDDLQRNYFLVLEESSVRIGAYNGRMSLRKRVLPTVTAQQQSIPAALDAPGGKTKASATTWADRPKAVVINSYPLPLN